MNKVILLGNLTKDPDIRYSQGSEPMCVARYTLAVQKRFKREGEADADFIPCVSFGKSGEFVERYLKKGKKVAVCGRIQVRDYTDNSGQRKWMTEVVVDEVTFAESKAASDARMGQGGGQADTYGAPPQGNQQFGAPSHEPMDGFQPLNDALIQSIDDDDLPF